MNVQVSFPAVLPKSVKSSDKYSLLMGIRKRSMRSEEFKTFSREITCSSANENRLGFF
jgi:hypothetical protein